MTDLSSASSSAASATASAVPRSNWTAAEFKLSANNGPNTLHGGEPGFGKQLWRVVEAGSGRHSFVKLALRSPVGSNGFPGNLDVTALISIQDNTLTLAWEATTDASTPVSLTWHPYFNLAGDPQRAVEDQTLRVAATHYLPVSAALIPTGEMAPVTGTPFDFRESKALACTAGRFASADRD